MMPEQKAKIEEFKRRVLENHPGSEGPLQDYMDEARNDPDYFDSYSVNLLVEDFRIYLENV